MMASSKVSAMNFFIPEHEPLGGVFWYRCMELSLQNCLLEARCKRLRAVIAMIFKPSEKRQRGAPLLARQYLLKAGYTCRGI